MGEQQSTLVKIDDIERNAQAAPCPCGGYADKVSATSEEIEAYQDCGRKWECCIGAFTCRICKARFVVRLPAPEME